MFVKVKLFAQDGDYVHTGHMPIFEQPPEVIIWGQRVFRYYDTVEGMSDETPGVDHIAYREAWTYCLVPVPGHDYTPAE